MRTTSTSSWLERGVPRPGETIGGKYRVDSLGGQRESVVALGAWRLPLGERVAIEVLRPELAAQGILVERFLGEGEAAMRIRSEHAVRVLDRGQLWNGVPYVVLEHVEGQSLAQVVSTWGRIPASTAVDWMLQASEAVAQAHSYGVVHGSLTLDWMLLARRPDGTQCVKVDFWPRPIAGQRIPSDVRPDVRAIAAALGFLLAGPSPRGSTGEFCSLAELARALAPFGSSAALVSSERIECLLEDRVSDLTRPRARPELPRYSRPSDMGRRGRPLVYPASGRVVLTALAMLVALGAAAFGAMYMSVPRGAPPSIGVAAMQPTAASAASSPPVPRPAPALERGGGQ